MIDLSPENVTKLDLSRFCEHMDDMYFSSAKPQFYERPLSSIKKQFSNKTMVPDPAARVSTAGLISAIDSFNLEDLIRKGSTPTEEIQSSSEFVPAHSIRWTHVSQFQTQGASEVFDSTVDWCGQPTSGALWLKKHLIPPQRPSAPTRAAASADAATAASVIDRVPAPASRASSARGESSTTAAAQPLRSSSRFGPSRASICSDYQNLVDADVAKDIAVRHLGGRAVDPEMRLWSAMMRRRPFPIRKTLSANSHRPIDRQLEFVSLFGPVPEKTPRALRREVAAALLPPPPGTPSTRPATATSLRHQRLLTGRPQPLASASASVTGATAAVATASFSDFGDVAALLPPQAPAAVAQSDARRRPSSAGRQLHRQRLRLPAARAAKLGREAAEDATGGAPVGLALLGNRFKYPEGSSQWPQSQPTKRRPASSVRIGQVAQSSWETPATTAEAADQQDPVAELAKIVSDANRPVPLILHTEWDPESHTTVDATAPAQTTPADGGAVEASVDVRDGHILPSNHCHFVANRDPPVDPGRVARAALVIQSSYRGYGTRQRLARLEQQAKAQGFESLGALRRCYRSLVTLQGPARQRGLPGLQEMQRFLEDKRRIELAFDTTIQYNRRQTSQYPSSQDLMKVFNVCGQFPSRQAVEHALEEWRLRTRCQGDGRRTLDRAAAVEIFYRVLLHQPAVSRGSPRRSPRSGPPPTLSAPQAPPPPSATEQPLTVRVKIQWSRDS